MASLSGSSSCHPRLHSTSPVSPNTRACREGRSPSRSVGSPAARVSFVQSVTDGLRRVSFNARASVAPYASLDRPGTMETPVEEESVRLADDGEAGCRLAPATATGACYTGTL